MFVVLCDYVVDYGFYDVGCVGEIDVVYGFDFGSDLFVCILWLVDFGEEYDVVDLVGLSGCGFD